MAALSEPYAHSEVFSEAAAMASKRWKQRPNPAIQAQIAEAYSKQRMGDHAPPTHNPRAGIKE